MRKVYIKGNEVWNYFQEHKSDLASNDVVIAEDSEYGTEIWISNVGGRCTITATSNGMPIWDADATDETECYLAVNEAFEDYLSTESLIEYGDEETELDMAISQREDEINDALFEFLNAVNDNNMTYLEFAGLLDDVKEHFLEYLARKHGIKIYRPMFLEDDEGEFYTEYPYECIVYDDPDNPLYKSAEK
jgi:hypothetical protein